MRSRMKNIINLWKETGDGLSMIYNLHKVFKWLITLAVDSLASSWELLLLELRFVNVEFKQKQAKVLMGFLTFHECLKVMLKY
jgi:hypothetical protein